MATEHGAGEYPARPRPSLLLLILAAIFALLGVSIGIGGIWLAVLGGSPYYILAGLALIGCALLLWRRHPASLWLYALLLIGTMVWAIGEVGLDFWQLAPRGDLLAMLGVLLVLPWVVRRLSDTGRWPGPGPSRCHAASSSVPGPRPAPVRSRPAGSG